MMNVIKKCEFCETALVFEQGGKTCEFTKHDDDFCKRWMREIIRITRNAMEAQAETMARACINFGMQTERHRGETREDSKRRNVQEMLKIHGVATRLVADPRERRDR